MTHGRYLLPSRSTARSVLPFQSSLDQWTFLNPKHPVKLIGIQYPPWNYQRVYPWIGRPSQKERIISQPSFFRGELLTLGSVHSADSYILGMISDSLSNSWMLYQLRSDKVVEISAKPQVPLSSKDPRVDFSVFSRSIFAHMVSPSQNHKIARPERLLRLWYTNMGILLNMRMSCCQVRLPENEALHWKVHLDDMIQKKSRSICLITWCINPSIVPIFKHLNRADLGVAGRDSHSAIQMV